MHKLKSNFKWRTMLRHVIITLDRSRLIILWKAILEMPEMFSILTLPGICIFLLLGQISRCFTGTALNLLYE